jgi:hypothetical protein
VAINLRPQRRVNVKNRIAAVTILFL